VVNSKKPNEAHKAVARAQEVLSKEGEQRIKKYFYLHTTYANLKKEKLFQAKNWLW
jgi:hypothetical protein